MTLVVVVLVIEVAILAWVGVRLLPLLRARDAAAASERARLDRVAESVSIQGRDLARLAGVAATHGDAMHDLRAEGVGHAAEVANLTRRMNTEALRLDEIGKRAAAASATATSHEAAVARWEATLPKAKRRRA